ncbi:MAG: type II secretion system protein [Candidatus Sumerlaeia bacterium]|nr:type II secretion system protein [Candidatus Sumerlaeia bacterium]
MPTLRSAFTLIELLVVVAIISILAAVALPNFLEAQTRAKVSRVKADMRTIATAFEAYQVDNNWYPPMYTFQRRGTLTIYFFVPNDITTPVAYLGSKGILLDPFKPPRRNNSFQTGSTDPRHLDYYNYINAKHVDRFENINNFSPFPPVSRTKYSGGWELWGYGPDQVAGPSYQAADGTTLYEIYDPTNGTVSPGDVRRTQLDASGERRME